MDFGTFCLYAFVFVVAFLVIGFIASLFKKKELAPAKKEQEKTVFALAIWIKNSEAPFMIAFLSEIDRDKCFDALRASIDAGHTTYEFTNRIDGVYCFTVLKYITAVHKTNG